MKKIGLMSAVLMSGAAMAADGIKLGGFADVGYVWMKSGSADAVKGSSVVDGALYFGKTVGMGEVFVDLPFASTTPGTGGFDFAGAKSQAWVSWKYDNGFWWKLGQFDYILGHEDSDSWGRFFSMADFAGLGHKGISNGLLVGYKASDSLNVSFLYANPADLVGFSATVKPDMGVKVDMTTDAYKVGAGLVMGASGAGHDGDYGMDIEVVASSKMGMLDTTINFDMQKDGAAGSKAGMGFGGHFGYEMSETLALGAAIDWSKTAADVKTLGLRVGPKWTMNKDFNLRVAFGYEKVSGATDADMMLGVNAVHQF